MTVETPEFGRTTTYSVGDLTGVTYTRDFVSTEHQESLLERILSSKQAWERVSGRRLQRHGGAVLGSVLVPAPLAAWLQPWVARIQGHCRDMGVDRACGLDWQPNHVLINAYEPGQGIMPHQDGPAYAPLVAILSLGAPCVLRFYPQRRETGPPSNGTPGLSTVKCSDRAAGGLQPVSALRHSPRAPGTMPGSLGTCGLGPPATPSGTACLIRTVAPVATPPRPRPRAAATTQAAPRPAASLVLEPGSLVTFADSAFHAFLHGIDAVHVDTLDASVCNAAACGLRPGAGLPRGRERVSLTVRRVLRTRPILLDAHRPPRSSAGPPRPATRPLLPGSTQA